MKKILWWKTKKIFTVIEVIRDTDIHTYRFCSVRCMNKEGITLRSV